MTKLTRRSCWARWVQRPQHPHLGYAKHGSGADNRHFWWGNPERDKRTSRDHRSLPATSCWYQGFGETIGWKDIGPRSPPRPRAATWRISSRWITANLFEYVYRGALKPLDEYVGKSLMIGDFDPGRWPVAGGWESFTG